MDPAFTDTYRVLVGYDEVMAQPMLDCGSVTGGLSDGFWSQDEMYAVATKPGAPVLVPATGKASLSVMPVEGPAGTKVSLQVSGCLETAGGYVGSFAGSEA